jgi:hypothetical protein
MLRQVIRNGALVVAAALAVYSAYQAETDTQPAVIERGGETDQVLARAYEERLGDLQISGSGVVVRVLSDDTRGSRHQRFIVELASGQQLLIVHNIDLAPRIAGLSPGDRLEFNGEYEWNSRGGLIHWTHHDPAGRHPDGWLRHRGRVYE